MHSLEAMMIEANDLHNEIILMRFAGMESFLPTNTVQTIKKWWNLFIGLLGKIVTGIMNGIKAAGRFVAKMWSKYIGSKMKVRTDTSVVSRFKAKIDRLINWLGRKLGFIKECQKNPESANDSFTQEEIDDINETLDSLNDILDEMLGTDSPIRKDLQDRLDELGLESYQATDIAMEAEGEKDAGWLKGIFNKAYQRLFNIMGDAKNVESEVKRNSEQASRTVRQDNLDEQSGKQAWYSKLASVATKIFNAIMKVIQLIGKGVHSFFTGIYDRVTGRGGVTVETNDDMDAPDLGFDDLVMDVGGL